MLFTMFPTTVPNHSDQVSSTVRAGICLPLRLSEKILQCLAEEKTCLESVNIAEQPIWEKTVYLLDH